MNLRALILAIIFVGIFTSIDQAKAQSVEFDFTFDTGLGTYFSGILFTSPIANQNGSFDVTNITGNRVDVVPNLGPQYTPILGLESTFFAPDNLLYYPATVLQVGPDVYTDGTGIGFSTSSFDYILFGGPQYSGANTHIEQITLTGLGVGPYYGTLSISPAPVPEPSQYGVFVFLAVAGFFSWRRYSGRTAQLV